MVDHTPSVPRLAIFFADFHCGGVERMRTLMSAEFLARGVEVDLVVLNAVGELLGSVPAGVRVISLDAPRVRHSLVPLVRYLQEQPPDALLADSWPLTTVAVVAARLARYEGRVVVVDHNTLSLTPLFRRWPVRLAMHATIGATYPHASARVGVSNGVAEDLASIGRLQGDSIRVIYNASATGNHAGRSGATDPWAALGAGVRVLTVGSLKEQKDHATLLRAFRELRDRGAAQLAIVGDGPLMRATADLAAELGVASDVHMPGFVDDVSGWYAGADVFVLSSTFEGFGNVIVEALDHGLPVVSTDCRSGPREILADGRFGTLVPVGDASALARAITETLRQPPDALHLQQRARDFLVPVVTEHYLELLFPGLGLGPPRTTVE